MSVKTVLGAFLAIALLSGCSVKDMEKRSDKYRIEAIADIKKEQQRSKLLNEVKEVRVKQKTLDLSAGMSLSEALKQIGEMEGRVYFLASSDMEIPALPNGITVTVGSFEKLNEILQDITPFKMEIVKNKFLKDRPKIVKVIDTKIAKSDLNKIKIERIESGMNVQQVFRKIAQTTKFNVVFRHNDIDDTNQNSAETDLKINRVDWFDSKSVFFYGETVGELLDYLSNSLDLFIDVDYDKRQIIVSKYKTKFFKLAINNVQINGSLSDGEVKNEATEGAQSQDTMTREYSADVFGELEEKLTNIVNGTSSGGAMMGESTQKYFMLNKITGDITVRTSATMMKDVEKIIGNFNKTFSKEAQVVLTIYEILLNQKQNLGIDIDYSFTDDKTGAGLLTALETANPINLSWEDGKNALGADINSNNKYGKIVGVKRHTFSLTNHIPYAKDQIQVEKYIAKETTTISGSGDNAIIESSQEIADALDGYNIMFLPFIKGDALSLSVNVSLSKTIDKVEKSVSETTKITTPTESSDNLNTESKIKKGERRILGALQVYEKVDNYEGIAGVDNFIIGGKTEDGIVEKETIFVLEWIR